MLLSTLYVLWASAGVLTLTWLFPVNEALLRRITTTGFLSSALWFWIAITGGQADRLTSGGIRVTTDTSALQYAALFLGVIALLAVVLNWMDLYPPEATDETDPTTALPGD